MDGRTHVVVAAVCCALAAAAAPVSPGAADDDGAGHRAVVHIESHDRRGKIEAVAVAVLDAPPARVLAALEDYEGALGPMPYLVEARVIRRLENGGAVVYNRTSPPLLPDRDYTVRIDVVPDGLRYRIANEEGPPPRPNVERVTWMSASWDLEPVDGGGRTRATYIVTVLPDAVVPRTIEHWAARFVMGQVFVALQARLDRIAMSATADPRPPGAAP